ncbi:C2H2-type domain-containing protein [Heracleum sosnowskyi]|uniref:C2H2-type domain-containing protein n=1 Tax=Heracleum sosnowskyi TaxID=360622 RepID=A0AAD8MKP1_9APIA|nr:C2H2-type domain-containing protein [Heracleum sosnowskyi]
MAAFGNRKLLNSVKLEGNVVKGNVGNVRGGGVKVEVSFCGVCGRRFYNGERLVNHFKQVHEAEQRKRVSQIASASRSRRVKLVGKFSMKMRKYRNAVREVLNPHVGNGLSDDLKRAGFWVKVVSDKRDVAGDELGKCVLNVVDMREVGCVVIVSDDSEFVSVLKEVKVRGVKTVVVGDKQDGELKRVSDAAFSWQEIILGKAKKEAVSVVGRWKDRDVLKSLEWSYDPETDKTQ